MGGHKILDQVAAWVVFPGFLDRVGASMLFVRAGDGKPPETGRGSVDRNTRQGAAGGAE